MSKLTKSGVYSLLCTANNKIYIGGTADLKRRKYEHFKMLKGGYHNNKGLQNDFVTYGIDNFVFTIIAECEIWQIDKIEQDTITVFNSNATGYNITEGGKSGNHAPETILQMRRNKPCKPVFGFSPEGVFLKQWESISECAGELKSNPCDVKRTINEIQISCKGFVLQNTNIYKKRRTRADSVAKKIRNEKGAFI